MPKSNFTIKRPGPSQRLSGRSEQGRFRPWKLSSVGFDVFNRSHFGSRVPFLENDQCGLVATVAFCCLASAHHQRWTRPVHPIDSSMRLFAALPRLSGIIKTYDLRFRRHNPKGQRPVSFFHRLNHIHFEQTPKSLPKSSFGFVFFPNLGRNGVIKLLD